MSVESFIKEETEKFVNDYKSKCLASGIILDELHESILRIGISQGIAISGMALIKTLGNITMKND